MSTGVGCTLLVQGVPVAGNTPTDPFTVPFVLEDLAVAWGREDTMSQPKPDTCTFQVLDPVGHGFGSTYRVGHQVDVLARGDTYPDPSQDTFSNPGFESATVTWTTTGATATRTTTRVASGSNALAVKPTTAGTAAVVVLAPAPFQPAGTNPDAWDAIPTTRVGQTWAATVALWVPVGAIATVRAALFHGPYAADGVAAGGARTVVGTSTWQTITAEHTVQVDDRWVGIHITLDPTGPAWDDVPPTWTWNALGPTWTWDDQGTLYVDDAQVRSPAAGTGRSVLVFSGRVTDLSTTWAEGAEGPTLDVTAAGFTADLDNRTIGDDPWAVESVDARAHRIVALSGLDIDLDVDDTVADTLVSYRDVDAAGATKLLEELAVSVDGVLWPAVHLSLGAYLRLEDPALRLALLQLALVGGVIVVVQGDPDTGLDLSACLIDRDPVTWVQDVADVVTRVAVGWLEQGLDDDGQPKTTARTEQVVDDALETVHGTRRVAVSTQLQDGLDAADVAQRILARSDPAGWRASGLVVDDDAVIAGTQGVAFLLDLLDGTSRIGAPIVLGDLPAWSPAGASSGVYLEGGAYRFVGGRWVLDLAVSAATGLGGSAAWDDLDPTWSWDQWDPDLTWNDLRGVAAP